MTLVGRQSLRRINDHSASRKIDVRNDGAGEGNEQRLAALRGDFEEIKGRDKKAGPSARSSSLLGTGGQIQTSNASTEIVGLLVSVAIST